MLAKYFALEDAMKKNIKHKGGEKSPWGAPHCPPCFGETGWDEKLGEILQGHGIALGKYVAALGKSSGFVVESGSLKQKPRYAGRGQCIQFTELLRTAASCLPE